MRFARLAALAVGGVVALVMVLPTAAQPPAVQGDTKVKAGKMLRLSVPLALGESALWDVYPPEKIDHDVTTTPAAKDKAGKVTPGASILRGTALPGEAWVKVTVYRVVPGDPPGIVTESKMVQVQFAGGQKVTPTPDDGKKKDDKKADPPTPPTPRPEAVSLVFAVVEEGTARTPAQAKVMADVPFWQSLKSRGHLYFHYKTTSPDVKALGYLDEMVAAKVAPPALLIMAPIPGTDTAAIRLCTTLPTTVAEIDAAGKRFSTK